jgi:hypothetical protein
MIMTKFTLDFMILNFRTDIFGAKAYLEEMEKAIPIAVNSKQEILKRRASEENWDWDEYDMHRQEIIGLSELSMPKVLSYSIITYLHSLLEVHLMSLANRLRKEKNIDLKINEMAGNGVERSKVYLTKVVGLKIADDPSWQTLRDLTTIRNLIVHRMGKQGDDKRKKEDVQGLKKRYKDLVQLSGSEDHAHSEIIISLKLCHQFANEIEEFFMRLFKECGYQEQGFYVESYTDHP